MPHAQLSKRIKSAIAINRCPFTLQLLNDLYEYINQPYDISWTREHYKLSPAEYQILQFMVEGMSPTRIAESTGKSVATVRVHKRNLYNKMRVSDMTQMMSILLKRQSS